GRAGEQRTPIRILDRDSRIAPAQPSSEAAVVVEPPALEAPPLRALPVGQVLVLRPPRFEPLVDLAVAVESVLSPAEDKRGEARRRAPLCERGRRLAEPLRCVLVFGQPLEEHRARLIELP